MPENHWIQWEKQNQLDSPCYPRSPLTYQFVIVLADFAFLEATALASNYPPLPSPAVASRIT